MMCVDEACGAGDVCEAGLEFLREAAREEQVAAADAPQCLLSLGLLQPLTAAPGQLSVVPPAAAAAVAMQPHARAATEATDRLDALDATFRRVELVLNAARQELAPEAITLRGLATINGAIDAAVAGCTTELLTARPGAGMSPEVLDAVAARSLEAIRRGVRQRSIYQHAFRSHRPTLEYAVRARAEGAEIRTVDKVVDRLIICDRRVCFISGEPDGDETALEVRSPGVTTFLVKVFEHTWDRGIAVDVSTGPAGCSRIGALRSRRERAG